MNRVCLSPACLQTQQQCNLQEAFQTSNLHTTLHLRPVTHLRLGGVLQNFFTESFTYRSDAATCWPSEILSLQSVPYQAPTHITFSLLLHAALVLLETTLHPLSFFQRTGSGLLLLGSLLLRSLLLGSLLLGSLLWALLRSDSVMAPAGILPRHNTTYSRSSFDSGRSNVSAEHGRPDGNRPSETRAHHQAESFTRLISTLEGPGESEVRTGAGAATPGHGALRKETQAEKYWTLLLVFFTQLRHVQLHPFPLWHGPNGDRRTKAGTGRVM
ncbi:hypothetical protein NFI96_032529 [Prochilodus magdalenae]|nr:hypothetical protein NFI96_032529 [Prochilodus magdalenae]